MDNPWNSIPINDYLNHMENDNVYQLQVLNSIIKEQLNQLNSSYKNVAILGITDGNGLEHIDSSKINKLVGLDINTDYLQLCSNNYKQLDKILHLHCVDMINEKSKAVKLLNDVDFIIANLIIEHIHLDNFIDIIIRLPYRSRRISCVIQHNSDSSFISHSGYEKVFECLIQIIEEIDEDKLKNSMEAINYKPVLRNQYSLQNDKHFIRLDFEYC